jgi:hypothetical protein
MLTPEMLLLLLLLLYPSAAMFTILTNGCVSFPAGVPAAASR